MMDKMNQLTYEELVKPDLIQGFNGFLIRMKILEIGPGSPNGLCVKQFDPRAVLINNDALGLIVDVYPFLSIHILPGILKELIKFRVFIVEKIQPARGREALVQEGIGITIVCGPAFAFDLPFIFSGQQYTVVGPQLQKVQLDLHTNLFPITLNGLPGLHTHRVHGYRDVGGRKDYIESVGIARLCQQGLCLLGIIRVPLQVAIVASIALWDRAVSVNRKILQDIFSEFLAVDGITEGLSYANITQGFLYVIDPNGTDHHALGVV